MFNYLMKTISKIKYCVALMLFALTFSAQSGGWKDADRKNVAEEFSRIAKWFSTQEDYSFKIKYASFMNYNSGDAFETSDGNVVKKGKNYHTYLLGVHTIQSSKCKLVIDSSKKIMAVADRDKLTFEVLDPQIQSKLIENYKAVKEKTDKSGRWIRVETTHGEITACEMLIGNDKMVKRVIYYYKKEVKTDDNKGWETISPRLEISIDNLISKKELIKEEITEGKFIRWEKDKPMLTGNFSSYKLIDNRISKLK
jgi:hypothetical protein